MKMLLLIPVAVATALAAAAGLGRMIGMAPSGRDLLAAACVSILAAELALLPAWVLRRAEPVTLAQAALGGTVLHLLLMIALSAAVMAAKIVDPHGPFVYWLMGAYWASLGMLVWGLIGIVPKVRAPGALSR
jgi:hypothetical protein